MPNTNLWCTRPLDPFTTHVMVKVIDPVDSHIYCVDGKDVLPVGADIWTDPEEEPPRPNAGWSVYFVKDKNTKPRLLDVHDWRPVGFDVSKPCLTCVTIYAKVDGIPYTCSRALTVIEKDESGGELPVIVTQSIPNGFVDHVYTADLEVTGTEPIHWSSPFPLPDGLTLNAETGQISGTPTVVGEYTVSIRADNIYRSAVKQYPLTIHGPSTLDVEVHVHKYFVGDPIMPDDLTVRYLGQEVKKGDYCLMYDPHRPGDQIVTVLYDASKEGIPLATASYEVVFHCVDDFVSNPIYFGLNESVKRDIHEYSNITNSNNLDRKREILRNLAFDIEPKEHKLQETSVGTKLVDDLGFLNNKLKIRHNKDEPAIQNMSKKDRLEWYDTIYRLCLTAILLHDYSSKELKEKIANLKSDFSKHRGI